MTKMFQINSEDLIELERILPELCDSVAMDDNATNRHLTQIRNVKRIISDVRWNYGPPTKVDTIVLDEDNEE